MLIDGLTDTDIGLKAEGLRGQQPASQGDIVGAVAIGEQAVMPDMVESFGEDVDQEAPNELMDRQAHDLVAISTFGSIVLPGEGDGPVVDADQPAVGDGEHGIGAGLEQEIVDDPLVLIGNVGDRLR